MSSATSNAFELVKLIQRKAPEYLDLLTASTEVEFLVAFDSLLARAVNHLEKNARNLSGLGEEGLTAVLVGVLSMPGLSVTQETNSNGHVDVTVEADHCNPPRIVLGEAKIYSGPAYHIKGMTQLIGRYTTGREGRGLLIVYVQNENISGLTKSLRTRLDTILPLQQSGPTCDCSLKWSFTSRHKHSCGDEVEAVHVMCNLYIG
ncbi:hypothetical protein [Planctopirus hydrillae]|uniref:Uncharacterized protein n=1 Tax=Planctopirus hydrillae TaxID=1841610 RepID=A0A1C3ETD5_9PLAN|nr:hypothetical protein [Planctopirus hydrillae]ODA36496.1 hypothetical protein A6X21_02090 [Planctopirus hydrillae]